MSNKTSKRHPDIPATHPGEMLREDIFPALERPIEQIAGEMEMDLPALESVLAKQAPITAEFALKLGKYLDGDPAFWMRLQASYDLITARQAVDVSKIKSVEAAE